MSGFVLLERV